MTAGLPRNRERSWDREVANGGNSILYFRDSDIAATFQRLQASGVVGVRLPQLAAKLPDHELWLAFVRDPDGNLVGLREERR